MADRDRTGGTPTISGAIVAGGQNARFSGQPKGLYRVHGIRIIDRVAAALRQVTPDIALIANDPDADDWLPGVPVIADDREERGSLIGLHSAVRRARDAVLVVAWDMPFVTPELLALIVSFHSSGAGAVVPETPRGVEPMCALYAPACLPAIDRAIAQGELRLSSVVARFPGLARVPLEVIETVGDPERLFFNVNSQADLELAERMARSH